MEINYTPIKFKKYNRGRRRVGRRKRKEGREGERRRREGRGGTEERGMEMDWERSGEREEKGEKEEK